MTKLIRGQIWVVYAEGEEGCSPAYGVFSTLGRAREHLKDRYGWDDQQLEMWLKNGTVVIDQMCINVPRD